MSQASSWARLLDRIAVCVDLGEKVAGLLLDGGDRIGSCDPA